MIELLRPPHGWQVGLDDPGDRVCDTLACPTEAEIAPLCLELGKAGLRAIPVVGYAHLTLACVEDETTFDATSPARPIAWRAIGIEATPYSVRLAVESPEWDDVLRACDEPPRRPYLTLAYALHPTEIDLAWFEDFWHGVSGESRRIEHHRFDRTCRPFQPHLQQAWWC